LSYQVDFTPKALKDLEALDRSIQRRVVEKVTALGEDPRPPGAKALQGSKGLYRVRVGDYRIIYTVEDGKLLVLVVSVGHRREVYR
jgi:mRNA interferase RelE/StbE